MHDIDLIDDSFLLRLTETYHLSVQTGVNGLSFAILDLNKLRYVVLRHYPFEGIENTEEIFNYLTVIYKKDDLLKNSFKNTSHVYIGMKSTLIPENLFIPENQTNYLRFLHSHIDSDITNHNYIPTIKSYNVFSYPYLLNNNINKLFKGVKLFHHSTSLITNLITESSKKSSYTCMVFLGEGIINIGIAKDSKLFFYNSFEFKDLTDIVYFILSVLEQFDLPAYTTDLYFSADNKKHNEVFDFLNNYLGQIHFVRPSSNFTYSQLFDEHYLTRFANLFNLALCE